MEFGIEKDEDSINIVYTWWITKLSLSAIVHKHLQLPAKILKVIKIYKSMVQQQVKANSRRVVKSRRKIDDKKFKKIRKYWLRSTNFPIYVEDVKRTVWSPASITKPPANQTIAKVMKSELRMSYRTLSIRHPKTFSSDSKRLFLEAAVVQNLFIAI